MLRKIQFLFLRMAAFCALAVLSMAITNCRRCVTEVSHSILVCELGPGYSTAMLFSSPIADTAESEIIVEWHEGRSVRVFADELACPGYILFRDYYFFPPLEKYTVRLTSDVGSCSGEIVRPGMLSNLRPFLDDTLPAHRRVDCSWDAVAGAGFYFVKFRTCGYDSLGNLMAECEEEELFTKLTSHTIEESYFDVSGASWYRVWFHVTPYAGSFPDLGEPANMSGSVTGFLTARSEDIQTFFFVGTPAGGIDHRRKRSDVQRPINAYLKALGMNATVKQRQTTNCVPK